jgi:hypothetical protein
MPRTIVGELLVLWLTNTPSTVCLWRLAADGHDSSTNSTGHEADGFGL